MIPAKAARHATKKIAKAIECANRAKNLELRLKRKTFNRTNSYHRKRLKALGRITTSIAFSDWRQRLDEFAQKCAYCIIERADTIEHMTPISLGGEHKIDNVVPACLKCNRAKGSKTILQWMNQRFNV